MHEVRDTLTGTEPMSKPVIYGYAAAVLAVGVVLMHVFADQWMPSLFPELQTPLGEPLPLSFWAKLALMGYLGLSVAGGVGVVVLIFAGLCTREEQRWTAESERRQQLWAMEE
jgi:hypothetical protein